MQINFSLHSEKYICIYFSCRWEDYLWIHAFMSKRREVGKIVGVAKYVGPPPFYRAWSGSPWPRPCFCHVVRTNPVFISGSSTAVLFMGWKAVQSRKQLRGGRTRAEAAVRRPTAGSDRSARRSVDPGRQSSLSVGDRERILGHSCLSSSLRPLCQRGRVHRSSQA